MAATGQLEHRREGDMKTVLMIAVLSLALTGAARGDQLAGDGAGCKDKTIAAKLAALDEFDPAYIEIWAKGMQDQSCRGYSAGQEVTVDERGDDMACVRAADDEACFWVAESMAP
jgi:hypothetical protein